MSRPDGEGNVLELFEVSGGLRSGALEAKRGSADASQGGGRGEEGD